ncbi:MAG: molybdopterin-dependent oxidoreductase [Myxococcota bacterium]
MSRETQTIHKTCNLCEATCGLLIDVKGNRAVRIRADDEDPFSRGHICPKAIALGQIQEDPDRLRHPVRRTAEGWERITWEAAFSEVSENLVRIQREYGDDAVATYLGNPAAHNFGMVFYLTPLYRALASRNRYSASSLDQNPAHAASLFLFGATLRIPVPDIDRTDFLLMLGANPVVSNGSLMTAPGFGKRVRELHERGGRFVVVDPRHTETAELADEHLFIRPGHDGLLLASLLRVVLSEKRTRNNHVWEQIDGLEGLERAVEPFEPESVAARVGIAADAIRQLARDFAAAPSAVCYGRIGICQNPFGTLNNWLVSALNIVTGNFDRAGGAMFPTPAIDLADIGRQLGGKTEDWKTRVRGAPSFNDEQPSACLAEEMSTPGEGQIRGLLTLAGNPALSAPNGIAIDRGLAGLDFFCAVDFYINETTRHANVILPPTWSLEHENYEVVFHQFAVHNTAKYSRPVLTPSPGTRHDWQILIELAMRIFEQKETRSLVRLGLRLLRASGNFFSPRRLMDWALRNGPYGDRFRPWRRGLRIGGLESHRKDIDLGPLEPCLSRVLQTQNGRIELAHPVITSELERLSTTIASGPTEGPKMVMIGRRDPRTNNSWMHNVPLAVKGPDRCNLIVHPDDAKLLGLDGAKHVSIRSRVATRVARLTISDEVMPGVVSLPHGWGHGVQGMRMQVASAHPGISFNDLADDSVIEAVVGNAVLNGIPVELEAVDSG